MPELLVDFITSLDGYGAADGWPGWWGLEGPEYLTWLSEQPDADSTVLMGANTYRVMSGLAAAGVGKHATRGSRRGRGRAGDEERGCKPHAHDGQPHPVPLSPQGRRGGPL